MTITSTTEVPFVLDTDCVIHATGFILDKDKGIIVTNKKAARISPSKIKIQFFDGSTTTKGKIIYSGKYLFINN